MVRSSTCTWRRVHQFRPYSCESEILPRPEEDIRRTAGQGRSLAIRMGWIAFRVFVKSGIMHLGFGSETVENSSRYIHTRHPVRSVGRGNSPWLLKRTNHSNDLAKAHLRALGAIVVVRMNCNMVGRLSFMKLRVPSISQTLGIMTQNDESSI